MVFACSKHISVRPANRCDSIHRIRAHTSASNERILFIANGPSTHKTTAGYTHVCARYPIYYNIFIYFKFRQGVCWRTIASASVCLCVNFIQSIRWDEWGKRYGTRHCVTNLHIWYDEIYWIAHFVRLASERGVQSGRETTEESNEFLLFICSSFIRRACVCVWGGTEVIHRHARHAYDFLINLMNNWFKKRIGIFDAMAMIMTWQPHTCPISVHIRRAHWHFGKIKFSFLITWNHSRIVWWIVVTVKSHRIWYFTNWKRGRNEKKRISICMWMFDIIELKLDKQRQATACG